MASPNLDPPYPIVGIQDGLDPNKHQLLRNVPVRMELDDWFQSEELVHVNQRALFFPAFWKFSQMDPHEKLSWFQIAGIHGKPFIAWDETPQKGVTDGRGYCTHNSILFSTWHRPYLLLFEQVVHDLMKKEIEEYEKYDPKTVPQLVAAAQAWRLPYWDWALKKPVPGRPDKLDYNVPIVITKKSVEIRLPTLQGFGDYPNAFYQFMMPGGITMGDASLQGKDPLGDLRITPSLLNDPPATVPFDKCKATSRHPQGTDISQEWIDGKQNNEAVAQSLRDYKWNPVRNDERRGNMTASLRDAFYRITTIERFEDFATKRMPSHGADNPLPKSHAFDSCESLHDNLHMWCGGERTTGTGKGISLLGHMSHVPLAAFDPIFWVHHSNIDRLIAIWQMLHEDGWFDGTDSRDEDLGTFAIERFHHDSPDDILRPFHKDSVGNYWTSTEAREVTALGYTYPGLEKWMYTKPDGTYDKESHIKSIKHLLNVNYNSAWSAAEKAELTADPGQLDGVGLMHLGDLQKETKRELVDLIGIDDYVVNVVYEKFALNGNPFTTHIFVGKVPDQLPYDFQETGTLVGEVVNFSTEPDSMGNSPAGCQNCRAQQQHRAESSGRVVLTNALITRWKNQIEHEPEDGDSPSVLHSMHPADVVKFLRGNLYWRVTSMGRLLDPETMPSLRISLAVGRADHYADRSMLSRFYDYKAAYEVTQGRPGGADREDGLYPPGLEYSTGA